MHAVVRPIVTIGVALVGTAVIVVNPIVAPPRDVAIPAKQSLASVQRDLYILDPAYLQALAAAGPQPEEPVEVVPRLVDALTADAAPVSREAIAAAFAFGVATVSAQKQTRASVPDTPAEVGPSADSFIGPGQVIQQTTAFQWALAQLLADANDVGAEFVTAAFAAGAVDAAMPAIADDMASPDELATALYNAVLAAIAPLDPSALVIDAIRTTIDDRVSDVASTAAAASEGDAEAQNDSVAAPVLSPGQSASAASGPDLQAAATAEAEAASEEAAPAEEGAPAEERRTSETTASASGNGNGAIDEGTTANGATDLADGNKVEPGTSATKPADAAQDRLERMADQFDAAFDQLRDRLRKIAERRNGNESGAADTGNSGGSSAATPSLSPGATTGSGG